MLMHSCPAGQLSRGPRAGAARVEEGRFRSSEAPRQMRFGSPEVAKLAGYVITSVTVRTFDPFGAVEM